MQRSSHCRDYQGQKAGGRFKLGRCLYKDTDHSKKSKIAGKVHLLTSFTQLIDIIVTVFVLQEGLPVSDMRAFVCADP